MRFVVALLIACVAPTSPADAALPDAPAALRALLRAPGRVAGDAVGGVGLVGAATAALAGDAVSLIDDNRFSRPLLHGLASGVLKHVALALSWTATGALEGLRAEDIERLPEASPSYLEAAPGVGRLDTFASGVGALWLAVRDAVAAPPEVALHLVGARETARALQQSQSEARTRLLGPLPAGAAP
jgi:hypothetical protein